MSTLPEIKKAHDEFKTMLNRGFSNAVCLKDCAERGDELIQLLDQCVPYVSAAAHSQQPHFHPGLRNTAKALLQSMAGDV